MLEHLLARGQFERFLPRLRDMNSTHRDAAMAEAWTSFFLFRNGFRILGYDPPGADGNEGDLTNNSVANIRADLRWDQAPVLAW